MIVEKIRKLVKRPPVISVLRLQGVIGSGGMTRGGLSDAGLAEQIERAFRPKRLVAVALAVNSPGGSPAQSSLIAARIRRLAAEKDVPVIAFCEDIAASGGYWLACAADEIFADASSIIGSIGVIAAGFGFHQALEKIGVERRVHTAGDRKSMWDPFQPERSEDVARLLDLQAKIHEAFRTHVAQRRGDRLADDDALFSGEIWVGAAAREVGLIDGIAHLEPEMKRRFGDEIRFQKLTPRRSLLQRLGAPGAADLVAAVEDRMAWARFGL